MDRNSATVAPMQGAGFYNRNSSLQAANQASAVPLLEAAAREVPADSDRLVLADYGSSEGRNSMRPVSAALGVLRKERALGIPITVAHVDLPSNDFASLLTLIDGSPDSYLRGHENVWPVAVGRSHFGQVFPDASVDLGWSANAIHWMSENPANVRDHGWAIFSKDADARRKVEDRVAKDWTDFLSARSRELKPGGKMVCQFMARGETCHGFEYIADAFWASVEEACRDGIVDPDELALMTALSAGRSAQQVRAPFVRGEFEGLTIRDMAIVAAPDPIYDAYWETGDAQQFGRIWSDLMRAANGPGFVHGLQGKAHREAVLTAVHDRLARRLAADPQPARSYNVLLVLGKGGAG